MEVEEEGMDVEEEAIIVLFGIWWKKAQTRAMLRYLEACGESEALRQIKMLTILNFEKHLLKL